MEERSVKAAERCIGLDLGDRASSWCELDSFGELVAEGTVETSREGFAKLLGSRAPARIVMEATRGTHWARQCLKALGHEVFVANPRRLDLITKSSRKTDRNDARMLARIGRVDIELLSPVHERGDESMQMRTLVRARSHLVRTRTKLVNQIRGSLKVFGHALPSMAPERFHARAKALIPEGLQCALLPLFGVLEKLAETIEVYDGRIAEACKRFPQTVLLRQIHGVGPLIALSFVMSLEDPRRFKDSRAVGAYLGLVPASRQSGASDPRLRITKHGDGVLRSLLVTAATHVMRQSAPDCDLKRYGRRIARGGTPRDKARARIAVARKLACLMHRLWLTGEVYRPLRESKAA
jgi:transposase